eukprot:m.395860 g.395860  ORF g.395860 m.395860 type:complete len:112 (+) comp56401_c0_seq8:1785-2120(+)
MPTPQVASAGTDSHLIASTSQQADIRELRKSVQESWTRVTQHLLDFGIVVLRRFLELIGPDRTLFPFVDDQLYFGMVKDYTGKIDERPDNETAILFKQTFVFLEATTARIR